MAGWFYWKDKLVDRLRNQSAYIGIDPEKIVVGKTELIPPSINLFLSVDEAGGRAATGAGIAIVCRMGVRCLIVTDASMNDEQSQDDVVKLALRVIKSIPTGFRFNSMQNVDIYDPAGNIRNNTAMVIEFYVDFTLEDE